MMTAMPSIARADFRLPDSPEARVLHQVRARPRSDRAMIRTSLGYSQPSVTRYVSALIDAGHVEEHTAVEEERVGRPRKVLGLDGRHLVAWGIHVGTRSTEMLVIDGAGRMIRHRTLTLSLRNHSPETALATIATDMIALARGLPGPHSVGVAFSAFIDETGMISSPEYGWEAVPAAAIIAAELDQPLTFGTGVACMAGHELSHNPISAGAEHSTLYFYARDILGHAWLFNGAVHRPHSGRIPAFLHEGCPPELVDAGTVGQHPLSLSVLLNACRRRGHNVTSLPQVAALADQDPGVAALAEERAHALARAIAVAVDVVDPEAVVLAGDTFIQDPRTTRIVHEYLRHATRDLRIQAPRQQATATAAAQIAVQAVWQDPLGPT